MTRPINKAGVLRPCVKQSGSTLIEVMVIIACMTILISTVGVFLNSLRRIERQAHDDAAGMIGRDRLDERFRADAHQARQVELDQDDRTLILQGPGQRRIEYRATGSAVVRTEPTAEPPRRESFRLPEAVDVHWKLGPQSPAGEVELSFASSSPHPQPHRLPPPIRAVIGLRNGDLTETPQP